jgi:hypothetical protein
MCQQFQPSAEGAFAPFALFAPAALGVPRVRGDILTGSGGPYFFHTWARGPAIGDSLLERAILADARRPPSRAPRCWCGWGRAGRRPCSVPESRCSARVSELPASRTSHSPALAALSTKLRSALRCHRSH